MYFGSVKFFKHLILSALGLILTVLLALSVIFIVLFNREKDKSLEVMSKYNQCLSKENEVNIPAGSSLQEIYDILISKGFTNEQIIDTILEKYPSAADYLDEKKKEIRTLSAPEYTKKYPELYADLPESYKEVHKTIYLTFDDGPSQNTLLIMSILDKYDIKATFFMSGSDTQEGKEIMKKVAEKGHSIGVHSYSHDYEKIYKSTEDYLDDFYETYQLIYNATGTKPDIFRFAGGSINNYNRLLYKELISEMTRRGFTYYDWNVSGEDASKKATWTSIYNNVLNGIEGKDTAIVLLHDSHDKERTVLVLEDLIQELIKDGYSFAPLTNDIEPYNFAYLS